MALSDETKRTVAGNACGFVGAVCLALAAFGLVGHQDPAGTPDSPVTPQTAAEISPAPAAPGPATPAAVVERAEPKRTLIRAQPRPVYYPLEVGRYWVYDYKDPEAGPARIERLVVRRELKGDRELYHFSDGGIAYFEDGRVFEISADGGVNVIPVTTQADQPPYVYRSQGMQIIKRVGAVDTVMVAAGRRYERCLEVITEFRALEGGPDRSASYSSFYARGIGLVGREMRSKGGDHGLSVALGEHGHKQL